MWTACTPGRPTDGRGRRDAADPAVLRVRRAWLESWIEQAIALLDRIDGDPDLEPDLADATSDLEHDGAELEHNIQPVQLGGCR